MWNFLDIFMLMLCLFLVFKELMSKFFMLIYDSISLYSIWYDTVLLSSILVIVGQTLTYEFRYQFFQLDLGFIEDVYETYF